MAVIFREVSFPPLEGFSATAPNGAVIGVIGEDGSGKRSLLRLAAGDAEPIAGTVERPERARLISFGDPLNLAPVDVLALDHALARHDALVRTRTLMAIERLRRSGATVLVTSHEEVLLRELADEVWWIHEGRLAAKGDPRETLEKYARHIARRLEEWGRTLEQEPAPSFRRGDGRAELTAIETLDAEGRPTAVWRSGEGAAVRVRVRYAAPVEDPVVGIMIRTRIGFEVFGTNTEIENVHFGPCREGETVQVTFRFRCGLCPKDYTVTAASHDPDGVWHDWMEDAVAVTVAGPVQTAGVARLEPRVEVERV